MIISVVIGAAVSAKLPLDWPAEGEFTSGAETGSRIKT